MPADGTARLQMILAEAASDAPFLGQEAPQPRRDETFLADGIMELKMDQISGIGVQRRIRAVKHRSPTTRPGSTPSCSKKVGSKSPL